MALLGPETCWDCRVQHITCVSEEVKNEFRVILKVEKRRQLEQATTELFIITEFMVHRRWTIGSAVLGLGTL